jgi:hypothetical protein
MKLVPDLSDRDPTFPPKLARVVAKMMAKKPGERYQTPGEVISALAPWLSDDGGHKVVVGLSGTDQGSSGRLQETLDEIASKRTETNQRPIAGSKQSDQVGRGYCSALARDRSSCLRSVADPKKD